MSVVQKGETVGQAEICRIFGISSTTFASWMKSGAPFIEKGAKGRQWKVNTRDLSDWLRAREVELMGAGGNGEQADERELKRRKLAAETAKVELELARVRGEVVPLKQLERALANAFAEVKTNLRSVPSRVATAIIGEESETRIKAVILKEIDQALETLGDLDLDEPDNDDD